MGTYTTGTKLYKPIVGETNWGDLVDTNFDRLSEHVYNVKSYGALGDGITDDRANCQAAINACSNAGGGIVFFPNGTYLILRTTNDSIFYFGLSIPSNVHIRSANATILFPYDTSHLTNNQALFTGAASNSSGWSIVGCILDGGETGATIEKAHWGITTGNANSNFLIADNEIKGFRGKGIEISGHPTDLSIYPTYWRIQRNYIHNMSHGNGIGIGEGSSDFIIADNLVVDSYQPGFAESLIFSGHTLYRGRIERNFTRNWGNLKFDASISLNDIVVDGNYIQKGDGPGTAAGLNCGGVNWNRVAITNNTVDISAMTTGDTYALKIADVTTASGILITNNKFIPTTVNPQTVRVHGNTNLINLTFEGNVIQKGGVSFDGAISDVVFKGNILYGINDLAGTTSFIISNNRFLGTDSALNVNAPDSVISNNRLEGSTATGSFAMNIRGNNNIIIGNRIKHSAPNSTAAIYLNTNVQRTNIIGNTIEHTNNDGTILQENTGANYTYFDDNQVIMGSGTPQINFVGANSKKGVNTGVTPISVTGSRTSSASLASLLTQLATIGLITDSTTSTIPTKTSAYNITNNDGVILGDGTTLPFALTLPTAVGITGQSFTIKRINSNTNIVAVSGSSSQTIDGSTGYALANPNNSITVLSDGSNWRII